jgi:hypothetical protein
LRGGYACLLGDVDTEMDILIFVVW